MFLYFIILCDVTVFPESVDVAGGGAFRTVALCCHYVSCVLEYASIIEYAFIFKNLRQREIRISYFKLSLIFQQRRYNEPNVKKFRFPLH